MTTNPVSVRRRAMMASLAGSAIGAATLGVPRFARAQASGPIKLGVLHSLSGTMAISEMLLKETVLMAAHSINAEGGVLGRKLEPVVVDPRSDSASFASMAEQLYTQEKVAVVFGCWTSASRKAVLPVLDKTKGLLYYAVQYEGQEQSPHVFYTGCVPNQQALPGVDYLLSAAGGNRRRFVLIGTDYVYPRTTNAILRAHLKQKGVADADIQEIYRGFGHADYSDVLAQARKFAQGKPTAIISTINGDSNMAFYRELAKAKLTSEEMPVMAFSVGEEELRDIDTAEVAGHLATWTYFMNNNNAMNRDFIKRWATHAREQKIPKHDRKPVVNDPMVDTWVGVHMWKQAAEKANSIDAAAVTRAMMGQVLPGPSGELMQMDTDNHHLQKTPMVGRIRADGQFDVVWKEQKAVRAQPWSPYLPKTS